MRLERWALDELTETSVTLLRSRYRDPIADPATLCAPERVMQSELSIDADAWSAETDAELALRVFQRFINSANRRSRRRLAATAPAVAASLPWFRPARDLREGDVYWAFLDDDVALDSFHRPADTSKFVAAARSASLQLWDVTTAARQAAKLAYNAALGRPTEEEDRHR